MKMIPSQLSLDTTSSAEKRFFKMLREVDLGQGAAAVHSLNLPSHTYKAMGEIDFVLVTPRAIIAIEVKGGRITRDESGIWTGTDRFGETSRRGSGPFEQARSALWKMVDLLKVKAPHFRREEIILGYGCVFPDIRFTVQSVEWTDEMVIDCDDFRSIEMLQKSLRRLVNYWVDQGGRDSRELTSDLRKEVVAALRPSFDVIPSLKHLARESDRLLSELTESQYRYLDMIEDNPRVLCAGGAGTGKTFLAAEVARRGVGAGKQVLVCCVSPVLRRFLASQLAGTGVSVQALADLAQNPVNSDRFDVLIVDEAQDLMNLDALVKLDANLKGGIKDGEWMIFHDSNNQSGLLGEFDPDALSLLESLGAIIRLPENCRNTHEIVTQTKLVTGADLGSKVEGHGPKVIWAPYDNVREEADALTRFLERLEADDLELDLITLLTFGRIEDSCLSELRPPWSDRIVEIDTQTMEGLPPNKIGFCSVADFKGLENQFVALLDVNRVDPDSGDLTKLYIGMSRPRVQLWIGIHRPAESALREVSARNLESLTLAGAL